MNGRTVLERFPAGGPRGSWPAEEFAQARRLEGTPAEVVMDLATDTFLVIVRAAEAVVD
ncbi:MULTISPECIES: hypothetical protein [Streptomyces]|uniref:Uncharacterized protein n=3 Tax=Streptomyces griseoaurantiacus TaxID=68213 RepID=F3NR54_9ACTN|nr:MULTISPECIES: hypothetical protein [Streptomyces]EGG44038.1 hypothetical protein SGM_5618 [Streptomyces griseoaurantiacus M045]MBA5222260.1 hypothetical protein [Streptomyces griseoaurantiacus]MCF0088929.1 hypothetical protein [Streptomyces sp. MH192]MCF0099133.1 hypothetical protein [Streptomyces sp. MH191]MDX3089934.1 hypothetical protein [Streptomyces sp. ME12-02E]